MNSSSTFSSWLRASAKIGAWIFTVITVLWLGIAVFFWADNIHKQRTWNRAEATVTKVTKDTEENSNIKYSYFTFTDTESNKEYTVKSKMGATDMPIYELGCVVEVIYPAAHPDEAEENVFIVQYILPIGFTLATVIAGIFALALFLIYRSMQRRAKI